MVRLVALLAGLLVLAEASEKAEHSNPRGFLDQYDKFVVPNRAHPAREESHVVKAVSNMGDKSYTIVSDREAEKDVQKLLTDGNGNTDITLSAIGVGLLALAAMLGVRMRRGLQSSTEADMSVNMAPVMEMKSQGSDINGAAPLEMPHLGTETSRRVGWGQLASENFQKSLPHILCAATATGQERCRGRSTEWQ